MRNIPIGKFHGTSSKLHSSSLNSSAVSPYFQNYKKVFIMTVLFHILLWCTSFNFTICYYFPMSTHITICPSLIKSHRWSFAWRRVPVIPVTQEAEAGWPLETSLGNCKTPSLGGGRGGGHLARRGMHLYSQLLGRLRQEDFLSLKDFMSMGGWSSSELW